MTPKIGSKMIVDSNNYQTFGNTGAVVVRMRTKKKRNIEQQTRPRKKNYFTMIYTLLTLYTV